MKHARVWIISGIFLLVAVAVGVWLCPHLPARVATHWGAQGQANGFSPRWLAATLPALVIAGLMILTWLLPVISPRKFEIKPFVRIYEGLMLVIQGFVLVTGVAAILKGAGYAVPIDRVATLGIGALLVVIGNYLGKLHRNFFIGIRTPWTLASTAVWERTHRLGGWTFMAAGVALIIGELVHATLGWLLLVVVAVGVGIPAVYSFVVYRRLEESGERSEEGQGEDQ